MTNEQHIENLKKLKSFHNGSYGADIDRAIKAIEQESSNDMVSRGVFEQVMWERDVAITQLKELGYGLGEKIKTDKDAISRQALLDAFGFSEKTRKWGGDHSGYDTMMLYEIQDVIESQPPVNPQEPKTGHWIENAPEYQNIDPPYICSECGNMHLKKTNYCDQCGAKMVEPQESEESE